jgi:outer membrane protease
LTKRRFIDTVNKKDCGFVVKKLTLYILLILGAVGQIVARDTQAQSAQAQGAELRFNVTPKAGLIYGEATETIYARSTGRQKLSELVWEMRPLFYAGMEADFAMRKAGWKAGLFARASFKAGIPAHSGSMRDSDWMTQQTVNGRTVSTAVDYLNYYSVHNNRTRAAFLADAEAGVSWRVGESGLFRLSLRYSMMYHKWAASGGSLLYPTGHSQDLEGVVCVYLQERHIFSPVVAFSGNLYRAFSLEASLAATPFVFSMSVDDHIIRDPALYFYGNQYFGLFVEPSLRLSWKPTRRFSLAVEAAWRGVFFARGNQKVWYYGDENRSTTTQGSRTLGSGYRAWDISILATVHIVNRTTTRARSVAPLNAK